MQAIQILLEVPLTPAARTQLSWTIVSSFIVSFIFLYVGATFEVCMPNPCALQLSEGYLSMQSQV